MHSVETIVLDPYSDTCQILMTLTSAVSLQVSST